MNSLNSAITAMINPAPAAARYIATNSLRDSVM
jgi:hypothetical protein